MSGKGLPLARTGVDSTFPSDIAENKEIESEVRFNLIGLRSRMPPPISTGDMSSPWLQSMRTPTASSAAAIDHLAKGAHDEAVRVLKSGGSAVLSHPVARNLLGSIYLQQGKKREALRAFEEAIRIAPGFPEAHCNRGVVLQELGRREDARLAYERAIKLRRDYPLAHFNLGNVLRDLRRRDAAIAAYGQAISLKPGFAEAHLNRGYELLAKERTVEALNDFDSAVGQRPNYKEALIARAIALQRLSREEDALATIDAVLAVDPTSIEALSIKAGLLEALHRYADALAVADELVGRDPQSAGGHVIRSRALQELARFADALVAAEEGVRLAPASHETHHALALSLGELGRLEQALDELDRTEALGGSPVSVDRGRAILLGQAGRLDEAEAAFARLLERLPDDPGIRYDHARLLLYRGDFERGWAEWESRTRKRDFEWRGLDQTTPPWRGEALGGGKMLVCAEQGYGDAIQFARFLKSPPLSEVELCLVVSKPLSALFARSFPGVEVAEMIGGRKGFDRQVSLLSLPGILGTRLETIPGQVPYLCAAPELIEKWRSRIGTGGFRVGISWQGNRAYPQDHFRSIPLALLEPLASVGGVRLISLQAVHGLDQLGRLPAGMNVELLGDDIASPASGFDEIAAVMANLDLVISVDSAVAHLAGALARPVWTAIRRQPEWRWLEAPHQFALVPDDAPFPPGRHRRLDRRDRRDGERASEIGSVDALSGMKALARRAKADLAT